MRVQRGGETLKTGKIGRANCIRQQILMPGEKMTQRVKGQVRLESLRERDALRINAHMATFMTPIRWLFTQWPDYIKAGDTTGITLPMTTTTRLDTYGLGAGSTLVSQSIPQFWVDAYLKCINEWYKWPENDDVIKTDLEAGDGPAGAVACPLSKTWSRMRLQRDPNQTTDTDVASATAFDVRDLAETQAKFRSAMKREILSFNRWMELVKEYWNGDGSREVDKVPMLIDQQDIGVNPREIPASDGASLGQWQSLFDFEVDNTISGIVAPEHCILTTILLIRFSPMVESRHPLASDQPDYWTVVADPEVLSVARPTDVKHRELFTSDDESHLGYLPSGWQWRSDHDVVGLSVDQRDSFPYSLVPTTMPETKDATRIKSAFRSQALDDYLVNLYFTETSNQPIGDSMESYFSGMTDDVRNGVGGRGKEFPKGGKQL